MSVVEHALSQDPCGQYAGMDFQTRDRYRHVVEAVANKSIRSEGEVAHHAVALARASAAAGNADGRANHVGFYLVDKGRPALERAVAFRPAWRVVLQTWAARYPLALYLSGLVLLSITLAGGLLLPLRAHLAADGAFLWLLPGVALLALLGVSRLSTALVNWLATLLATPHPLPRMDFSTGIPPQWRTLVVVPTMLSCPDNIDGLLEALEVRFLANDHCDSRHP